MLKQIATTGISGIKYFNFITLFGQTLGVFTVKYDGQSLKKLRGKERETNLQLFLFETL